jgi:hypothetical protein
MVERKPTEVTFPTVAVVDRSGAPVRRVKLAIGAAALVVVTALGSNLLGAGRDPAGIDPTVSSVPSRLPSTPARPSPTPEDLEIEPGSYALIMPQLRIHLTMPAGWSSAEAGAAVWKPEYGWQYSDGGRPSLGVHEVTGVATDICGPGGAHPFRAIGPTAEDLVTAFSNLVDVWVSGPIDARLGGYPAKQVDLTLSPDFDALCGGDGRWLWEDASGSRLALLKFGVLTVYIVDVDGDRVVIARNRRSTSARDIAQLDAMVASIEIEPTSPGGAPPVGRHSLTVDGVSFSFSAPGTLGNTGWAPGPIEKLPDGGLSNGSLLISKSIGGGQGAEAVIYWTGFPDGTYPDPCTGLLSPSVRPSASDLAAALAAAPGTELVSGPSDLSIGGRPAKHVVLTVREDLGCDPGYFYTWQSECWGPCWMTTDVGTTILAWIVDVDGTLLFIEGETHENAGPRLEQEIQDIVDTIQFE